MTDAFDKQQALEQTGNNSVLAKDLFEMLIAELPEQKNKLQQALTDNDHKALRDHAHKIHGSTAYCGVPGLKAAAYDLECLIRDKVEARLVDGVTRVAGEIDRLIADGKLILAQFD